jgi:hypothetical protein
MKENLKMGINMKLESVWEIKMYRILASLIREIIKELVCSQKMMKHI